MVVKYVAGALETESEMNGCAAQARRSARLAEQIGSVVNFLKTPVLFIVLFFRIFFQLHDSQRPLFLKFRPSQNVKL